MDSIDNAHRRQVMSDNDRQRARNDAIVAFVNVVATAVVVLDETGEGKVSAEEFLETVDQALSERLNKPDGAVLAASVRTLCDVLRMMVRRRKSRFEMERAIDEIFDKIDREGGI